MLSLSLLWKDVVRTQLKHFSFTLRFEPIPINYRTIYYYAMWMWHDVSTAIYL